MLALFILACIIVFVPKLHYTLAYTTHLICAALGAIAGYQISTWLFGFDYVMVSIVFVGFGLIAGIAMVFFLVDLLEEGKMSKDARVNNVCKGCRLVIAAGPISLVSGYYAARFFLPEGTPSTAVDLTNAAVLSTLVASVIGFVTLRAMLNEPR